MDGGIGRKPNVTSSQVARLAGVSQSAVSRCFTEGASISDETRQRVMEAARQLGYRPNALARSLITNRSHLIAVVVAYLDNLFYPDMLETLGQRLAGHNYRVLLFTAPKEGDSDPLFDQLMQYRVDGIVLASTSLSSRLSRECVAAGVPVVLFNRTTADDDTSSVTTENAEGGRRVAEFLLAAGHRRFAYIAGLADSSTNRDRLAGFRDGLRQGGIFDLPVARGDYSRTGAENAARELLGRADRPEAIFVANDHMAVAVLDVARFEFGLKVPEQLSIVGYDDVGAARWPSYDITTVTQPIGEMVGATVAILMEQIASGEIAARHVRIGGDLVVRGSARRPATGLVNEGGRLLYRP